MSKRPGSHHREVRRIVGRLLAAGEVCHCTGCGLRSWQDIAAVSYATSPERQVWVGLIYCPPCSRRDDLTVIAVQELAQAVPRSELH